MFGSLGIPEVIMILVIALIIFGPRKLPQLGRTLGQSLAQFRRASEDFKRTWEQEITVEEKRLPASAPSPSATSSKPAPAGESHPGDRTPTNRQEARIEATHGERPSERAQGGMSLLEPTAAHHERGDSEPQPGAMESGPGQAQAGASESAPE